jgi:putative transposase
MGNTFSPKEELPMPWKGVTVSEQRENFLRDYYLRYYSLSDLAERYCISRKSAYKWIERYEQRGREGLEDQSRRPHSCPWQTEEYIAEALVELRLAHPSWGPRKLLDVLQRRHRRWELPAASTVAQILSNHGLVRARHRHRRAHPGCPQSVAQGPNDIWGADYKGQFRMGNGKYCFPQTVSDLDSRFLLGCDGHPQVDGDMTEAHFDGLFRVYGLPNRMRTDNGSPFASNALGRLSCLSVWWIKLGIYPELIEPGRPQQNGIHERMHRTLKPETTHPPARNMKLQQNKFDEFRKEYNEERPHEALEMKRPAEVYRPSKRRMPQRIGTYDYPLNNLVRRVSRCGTIRVFGNQVFVSQTLNEEYVALEEIDDGIYDMFFCFYLIGRYELRTNTIHDIISKVSVNVSKAEGPTRVSPMSSE